MEPFTTLTSLAVPLPDANIDTDIIFPARFLLMTQKKGLGDYAFFERRHGPDGEPDRAFPLNDPAYRGAAIMVAGSNFGCGSSREQAAWALADLGVRCVISSAFGEIFAANCYANGMLPIVVAADLLPELLADAAALAPFSIDLDAQTLSRPQRDTSRFDVPGWRKAALLNGWDEVDGIVDRHGNDIARFEARQRGAQPWLYAGD